jgi:hypothetical protein
LADVMGATCVALDGLDERGVLRLVRDRVRTVQP